MAIMTLNPIMVQMLGRKFHRAGALSSWRHYVLPAEGRYPGIRRLIDEGRDLVVTGPKGAGKTTLLASLARELSSTGCYAALFVRCRPEWTNPDRAIEELQRLIVEEGRKLSRARRPPPRSPGSRSLRLRNLLSAWSLRCDGGAVLFLDDLDEVGPTGRLAILRQVLRCSAGPEDVPLHLTAVLGGISISEDVRQVEDEVRHRAGKPLGERLKLRQVQIGRFEDLQVGRLYDLHTARTGQVFTEEAKETALRLTQGEPRRINAIADEALRRVPRQNPVQAEDIRAAYDRLWPVPSYSSPAWSPSPIPRRGGTPRPASENGTLARPHAEEAFAQRLRPGFLFGVVLLSLALTGLLLSPTLFLAGSSVGKSPDLPIKELEIKKVARVSEPESYEALCADLGSSAEKFEACRRKLPVFERTYLWIDTDSLVKEGEALGTEHLGLLYGVSRPADEASRLALAAVLVSECLGRQPSENSMASFEELFEDRCRERLPTLAHLGLEIDPSWLAPEEDENDPP